MSCGCEEILSKLNELLNNGVALRFIKSATAHDLDITQDNDSKWRLHVTESGEIENDGQGTILALSVGDTANLYNQSATARTKIYGFAFSGDTDARATLYIDSLWAGESILSVTKRAPIYHLPRPLIVPIGVNIRLELTNIGIGAADYRGMIWLERI